MREDTLAESADYQFSSVQFSLKIDFPCLNQNGFSCFIFAPNIIEINATSAVRCYTLCWSVACVLFALRLLLVHHLLSFVYCFGLCRRWRRRHHHLYHSRSYFVIIAVIFAIVVAFCFYCFQLAFTRVHISNEFALVEIIPAQHTHTPMFPWLSGSDMDAPRSLLQFYCLSKSLLFTHTQTHTYTNVLSRFVAEHSMCFICYNYVKSHNSFTWIECAIESLLLHRDAFFIAVVFKYSILMKWRL